MLTIVCWTGKFTENTSGLRGGYSATIFTIGGGCTWRFSRHFYLNPWAAAVRFPISGDWEVRFSALTFSIDPTPEVSIKLGVKF
ncbi:MAG: hypothetical protein ONA69_00600 [candidate division KSB1 bacterium]|nr:hypothetical protein [candidate division KSB1 bacterium]MDZ7345272.1 hypothetical protein [candidate division KSB1 bacterium]